MFYNVNTSKSLTAKTSIAPLAELNCVLVYNRFANMGANVGVGPDMVVSDIGATEEDILSAPAHENQMFDVWGISVYNGNNEDHVLTIYSKDSGSGLSTPVYKCDLRAYERLEYTRDLGWVVYDKYGNKRPEITGRVLEQKIPGAVLTDLYEVPENKRARVGVTICNRDGNGKSFRIALAKNGETDYPQHYLYYDHVLIANETHEADINFEMVAGDVIRVYGSTSDIVFTCNGIEY